jgi:hypothetical protein
MRTRLAITSMLVIGVLFTSTGGVAMALSGTSGSGSAAGAQYGAITHHHSSSLKPATTNNTPTAQPVQQVQQLATPTSSSTLPFTGLVLIPLIVLGVAMLLVGLVLRSRSTRAPNQ